MSELYDVNCPRCGGIHSVANPRPHLDVHGVTPLSDPDGADGLGPFIATFGLAMAFMKIVPLKCPTTGKKYAVRFSFSDRKDED